MKKAQRGIKTIPGMHVTEKDDFYRLLHRTISAPSSSAATKPGTTGTKNTRQ
jgi:hypothetical protein